MSNPVYCFLALCARADCGTEQLEQIARAASHLDRWDELPTRAEAHGLAPLLYTHLRAAGVSLPRGVKREFQGIYVRYRHGNGVRMRVLQDVLAAFDAASIPVLVLKGSALVPLVYAEPGLRPMADLDLLVSPADARHAQAILGELGFDAPLPAGVIFSHRHLPMATRDVEGVPVGVELHHRLSSDYAYNALSRLRGGLASLPLFSAPALPAELDGLTGPPLSFSLGEREARTLGYEDMLGHLCWHLISHVNVWEIGRLIWVADVVSFSERYAAQIDWQRVRRRHPAVLGTLSLLHTMTPLSQSLLDAARLRVGRTPSGIGESYRGWPVARGEDQRGRGVREMLRATLLPSEWWLRLRYAMGSARPLFCHRWVRHPLHLFGHAVRVCLERVGWPAGVALTKDEVVRFPRPRR